MYYREIDTEMPAWAMTEIHERSRRAWNSFSFYAEERREKAEAEEKAEQERES